MIEYHRALLADDLRTRAYREAILRVVQPGDVVVDLGCGSGILSFFACEAGASKVYAIDQSHMADVARFMARHLGLADRVEVLHEESAKVELPERGDVLVTETMGAFGFDEHILGSVLDARARLLRPGATIVPQRLALSLVPVDLAEDYEKLIAWWSARRYHLDLSPLRVFASNSLQHVYVQENAYLATPVDIIRADLMTIDTKVVRGRTTFTAQRSGMVHGFAVWFKATLAEDVVISNRGTRATHWSQGLLPLEQPIPIAAGGKLEVELETDDGKSWRWRGQSFDQTSWFSMPPCAIGRES